MKKLMVDVTSRLVVSTCKSIAPDHIIIRYNVKTQHFEALFLQPTGLNDETVQKQNGFVRIKALDKIHFFCANCYMPHLYYLIFPFEDTLL